MKKSRVTIILCLLSLSMLTLAGNVAAYGATHIDYSTSTVPTIDGTYGTPSTGPSAEWANSQKENFGTSGIWRDGWAMADGGGANEWILAETADATDDADDYWQICFDGGTVALTDTGAAAPGTDDRRVDITGHSSPPSVQWYQGTGSGWTTIAAPSGVTFAISKTTSPTISTEHYILEMAITPKTSLGLEIYWAIRVAYNDAHTGDAGLQQWPTGSNVNTPSTWGVVDYQYNVTNPTADVPEGYGFFAVAALSAIAVVAGAYLIRKRTIARAIPTKTIV